MEILLCQDVHRLGKAGDIVKVKRGYARNFLLPKKIGCLATPANVKRIEIQKAKAQEALEQEKKQAQELAEKISKASCTVTVEVNDLDKLYGSVTEAEIIQALELEGITLDKNCIQLENPINELGIFEVTIKLHPEVETKVRVWVAKK